MRSALVLALVAGLGFALTTWALRQVLPPFELPGTSVKLEHVAAEGRSQRPYDVLVLGSSRTWRAFDPALFDARLAARGRDLRSFNFGAEGMLSVASWQVLDRMAQEPPAGLKWVLIDPESLTKALRDRRPRARGIIGWHRPRATWILLRLAGSADAALAERADAISRHLLSGAYQLFNVGRASEALGRWLGTLPEDSPEEFLGADGDGFAPFVKPRAEGFHPGSESWEHFLARREAMRVDAPLSGVVHPAALELYRALEASVRRLGAEPVFVIGPSVNSQPELREAQALGAVRHVLRLNEPERYPALFHLRARYDQSYLNADGAVVYSQELAEAFDQLLRGLPAGD